MSYNNLYIVDNSEEKQSVKEYLTQWCKVSKQMDIATGYLEIGGFLCLDTHWQKLDKIRIILGNEMTKRTKNIIDKVAEVLINRFSDSIDTEHEKNDYLEGVPAILDAMKSGKIECRVFDKNKFHAKAYITYFNDEYKNSFIQAMNVPSGYALVGSSNFTKAGLTQNIELNVQIGSDVDKLQDWFNKHWERGEDITTAVLSVIENHVKSYSPYDVYVRSMYEYFKGHAETITEWENNYSLVYPKLSQYQKDGYNSLIEIANRYSGAFLCDGVGLGKTFVGMMLIERFVKKERKNVVLLVTAATRVSVWETTIKKCIPEILEGFYSFKIINHTDLILEKNENLMNQIQEQAEIIIIDEAHNFRNRSSSRYRKLFDMMSYGTNKKLFMLTATPINNSFLDLQHLIELFTNRKETYFEGAPLGIHSLTGHFRKMEAELEQKTEEEEDYTYTSEHILKSDSLVNALVVQRSRAYVKKSLLTGEGDNVIFPERQPPIVADYSLRASYGRLIDDFIKSFYRQDEDGQMRAILALAVYFPYDDKYYIGDRSKIDDMVSGRQRQVVNLIRQLLLKRFESSVAAFEETCIRIYSRLYKFLTDYQEFGNVDLINRIFNIQDDVIKHVKEFIENKMQKSVNDLEDELPDYIWNTDEKFNVDDFNIKGMIDDTIIDLEVLAMFIRDIMEFDSSKDDKIRELKRILEEAEQAKDKKVIIFTEYRATAKYIYNELQKAGFEGVYEIDGQSKVNRHDIVVKFSPYYNDSCSADVQDEIRVLIATDVLSEGLNLQDASCLINYELHWNPVRLMQRIGRIDRRRDISLEDKLLADHPELNKDRNNVYFWNFLPPEELEELLALYKIVSNKVLRISKIFGIEGKKILTPDDEFAALLNFNSQYEGEVSTDEEMHIAYQELIAAQGDYMEVLKSLPKKMYSGKQAGSHVGFFFCYELPMKRIDGTWTDGDGLYKWYLLDVASDRIYESAYDIWKEIQCKQDEPRKIHEDKYGFIGAKKIVETHINKDYMRSIQAPVGTKPRLVTWMELC